MKWIYKDLQKWIANGCNTEIGKQVVMLNISHNKISEIPKEIFQLFNLETFDCSLNKISEIPKEICQLINLREFYCGGNNISEIPKEIGQLINLQKFYCFLNNILEIPKEIGQLINLQEFHCYCNGISEIPKEIGQLINLRTFDFRYNKISEIPIEITRCIKLIDFEYSNNTIEYIPPQVIRFLNRKKFVQKIYNDTQSVHNHNIQSGIFNSVIYITQKKTDLTPDSLKTNIFDNDVLEKTTKELLFEYIGDKTVHSVLNITFEELLISVYDFILNHECQEEIFKILNKEMNESMCKCFTGRMSRLINTLNGFDENIKIQISDAEQIGNICILVKQKLEMENNYSEELLKETVKKELSERGYDENVINEWLENI